MIGNDTITEITTRRTNKVRNFSIFFVLIVNNDLNTKIALYFDNTKFILANSFWLKSYRLVIIEHNVAPDRNQ